MGPTRSVELPLDGQHASAAGEEDSMPRRKSLLTIVRDLVQQEVRSAFQTLVGTISPVAILVQRLGGRR